jgi:hypothetical protein
MKSIICFLTVKPNNLFLDFCEKLVEFHDIYICIDDNNYNIDNKYTKFNIIKIDNLFCENIGYKNSVYYFRNKACSRDKAIYYFCNIKTDYTYLWMIEEDVLIPKINTILDIDNKYIDDDLLCKSLDIMYEKKYDWHWNIVYEDCKLNLPYASSMICAIRVSNKLMMCIKNYVDMYHNLFLDETLFTTIALHNNLKINTINELSTISYDNNWNLIDIIKTYLYHPIKNISEQHYFRNNIIEHFNNTQSTNIIIIILFIIITYHFIK